MPRGFRGKLQAQLAQGFTLVELLVVIAIIGILMALLLPAIQSARESGRQTVCSNHIKQVSFAVLNHNTQIKTLPAGGWGYAWIGDPDRGNGRKQPGGWIYNILPYIEEKNLHDLGAGLPPQSAAKKTAAAKMIQTPLEVFNCPTRRPVQLFPAGTSLPHFRTPNYSDTVLELAHTDYAGNGGSVMNEPNPGPGPKDIADFTANWDAKYNTLFDQGNGVFTAGNVLKLEHIRDGTSHTYLVGEKKINVARYYDGSAANDNESLYMGGNGDIHSWGNTTDKQPEPDMIGTNESGVYGSAHTATFNISFCDGSVHRIPFEVDPAVHQALANRKDGVEVNTSSFE